MSFTVREDLLEVLLRARVRLTEDEKRRIREALEDQSPLSLSFMIFARRLLLRGGNARGARMYTLEIRAACRRRIGLIRGAAQGWVSLAPAPERLLGAMSTLEINAAGERRITR